ncbi:MAG TPA: RHS repeat-associated core domain-containing protein [Candidatus Baltobacteraceae bacterium]|nr:RHS repeat-associated core domain-containing protein [Candidatus Baltobacteraceae bacterium]
MGNVRLTFLQGSQRPADSRLRQFPLLAAYVVWMFLSGFEPETIAQPAAAPPPILTITPLTNSAVSISWPKTAGAVSLLTSTNLSGDQDWETVLFPPFEYRGFFTTVAPRDTPIRFYELSFSPNTNVAAPLFAFPELTITQPVTNFTNVFRTNTTAVNLAGTVNGPAAVVMVQGALAGQTGTNWAANAVPLSQEGDNLIVITATNASGAQTVENLIIDRDTTVHQPQGLQVLALAINTNQITWLPSGESDLTFTRINRRTNSVSDTDEVLIGVVPAPSTLFNDTNLPPGVTFCYKIQSVDNLGNQSPFSEEVCAVAFGVGFGGGLGLTGGSVDPSGNTSSSVEATSLTPVTPIQYTNGTVRARYISGTLDEFSQTDSDSYEILGPDLFQLYQASFAVAATYQSGASLLGNYGLLVENDSGFGNSINVTVTLPPGFIFNPPLTPDSLFNWFQAFAAFPNAAPGALDTNYNFYFTQVNWDMTQTAYYISNPTTNGSGFTAVAACTSNQITLTASWPALTVPEQFPPDYTVTNVPLGVPKVLGVALDLSLLDDVVGNPTGIIEPAPKIQMTVNGTTVEAGLGMPMDPDPLALAPFQRTIDDGHGMVDLVSGDYSFDAPLFMGHGEGLNLQCGLSYSSWKGFYDYGAMQQAQPSNYTSMPFGPGWSYPYGMRIIPRYQLAWSNGIATSNIYELYLVSPDGRVTPNLLTGPSSYCWIHRPAPEWACFSAPTITTNQTGYAITEASPTQDGFQEIDFNLQGLITNILMQGGATPITISYSGSVQTVTDSSGRSAQFTYDSPSFTGKIVQIDDPAGGQWVPTYSGNALVGLREQNTGYGWEFAYDATTYVLTERMLPHGFVIQADYATPPSGSANPTNFFWGTLVGTHWKETPSTSARTVSYHYGYNPASVAPDRITITDPSGRNTSYFDTDTVSFFSDPSFNGSLVQAFVIESDQVEGSPSDLRYLGSQLAQNTWQFVDLSSNAAGNVVSQSYDNQYPVTITREDGTTYQWQFNGLTTDRSPASETGWRGFVTQFSYYDAQSPHERLQAVFPPGQDSATPGARSIQYNYDSSFRVQSITDLDSNVTQMVYFTTPGKLQLPYEIIPLYNLSHPITTGGPNPYTWVFDYDGLGRRTSVTDPNQNVTKYVYDTAGRLTTIIGPTNPSESTVAPETDFSYQGDLLVQQSSRNPAGPNLTITYIYDNQRRLVQVIQPGNDPTGAPATTSYAYDDDNNVTNIVYPNLGSETRQYDNRCRMTESVGPMGEVTEYTYDDSNDQITDMYRIDGAETRTWTVVKRDPLRRVLDMQLPNVVQGGVSGRPEQYFNYDQDGNITNQTYAFAGNSMAKTEYFGYFDDCLGSVMDMGGGQGAARYYANDYAGRTTNDYGLYLLNGWSSSPGPANIQSQPTRAGPTVATLTYSPFSTISGVYDAKGNQRVSFSMDAGGLLKQISVPNLAIPQFGSGIKADTTALTVSRDNFNLVNGFSDVFGDSSEIDRDSLGRAQSTTDPVGTIGTNGWSAAGDPAAATTIAGGSALDSTRTAHDDLGNPTQIVTPGNNGTGTTFEYDLSGRLTSQTDAGGHTTSFQYNAFGELTNQTYPSGSHITYMRDQLGRVTNTTEYYSNGTVSRNEVLAYDWRGDLASIQDADYEIDYTHDNMGRTLARRTVFNVPGVTNELDYQFGAYGDLLSEQDSQGFTVQYNWDDFDNVTNTSITPPAGGSQQVQQVSVESDNVGRTIGWTLASGGNSVASASLGRDAKGRLAQLAYSDLGISFTPLLAMSYNYDARDMLTNIMDYSRGLSGALGYDPRGYLISETWSQLSDGAQIYQDQIGYDPAGNRQWRNLNGNISTYTYNSIYQLTQEAAVSLVRVPTNFIHASADSTNRAGSYDPSLANCLQGPDSQAPGSGWDSASNSVAHWIELDLTNTGELPISAVEVSVPTARGGVGEFQMEVAQSAGGNFEVVPLWQIQNGYRVSTNSAGTRQHAVRVTFVSPQLAAAVRVLVPAGGTAVNPLTVVQLPDVFINEVALYTIDSQMISRSYDPDGRLISDGSFTYTYDVRGHLTGLVGPGVDKTWTITPEGLRGSETDNLAGQTRYFANDGADAYFEFSVSGGTVVPLLRHFNAPGLDNHIGFFEYTNGQPQFRWSLVQGPGNVAQVTDQNGNVLDNRVYSAWGQDVVPSVQSSGNPYGFAGARQDSVTGLCYNRARMYDPAVGRFQAGDPLGLAADTNPYMYARNDGVNGSDPCGLADERVKEKDEWVGYKFANGLLGLISNGSLELDTDTVDRRMTKTVNGAATLLSEPLRELTDVTHLGGDAVFGGDESGVTELTSLLGGRIQSGMAKGESGFTAGAAGLKQVGGIYVKTLGRGALATYTGGVSEVAIGGVEMGVGVYNMYNATDAQHLEEASETASGGALALLGGALACTPAHETPPGNLSALAAEEESVEASALAVGEETSAVDAGDLAESLVEPVEGGMSIFTEPRLTRYVAKTMPPAEGWFNVGIHGRSRGRGFSIKYGDGWVNVSSPQLLRAMIKAGWKGENIRLWSCNAGAGSAAAAWRLHKLTGVAVMAPTRTLWVQQSRGFYSIGKTFEKNNGVWEIFDTGLIGQ